MGETTSGVPEIVLDLPGFRVLTAGEYGGELEVVVETMPTRVACGRCGTLASSHGRREHVLRDIAVAGRETVLVWWKRSWRCRNISCPTVTWSETMPGITARAALTDRVRTWAATRVGQHGDTVAAVARQLGTGWATIMRSVTAVGTPLVDDPGRLAGVQALGVDEHAWQRANPSRHTQFATGIVDLSPGRAARLLDVTQGRSGTVYSTWLAARDPLWRSRIRVAALDPFRGYLTALRSWLPHATHVVDAFHVVKLGFAALDDVRRRVQQEQHGHRGHAGDPLYEVRRVLRRRADRLTDRNITKIETALHTSDPNDEVLAAWLVAQDLAKVYTSSTAPLGKDRATAVIHAALTCPVPEVARLGRTLTTWKQEVLAYFTTDGASNGPTEAINLLIEKIRRVGHGYRNFNNYRLRLLLHCGTEWPTILTPRIRRRSPRLLA